MVLPLEPTDVRRPLFELLAATGLRISETTGLNATRCCGPCSSALRPPHCADRWDRAQVLDQHPVDGESALA
jgi:hypothetical protein